jgi:hypothetical protein
MFLKINKQANKLELRENVYMFKTVEFSSLALD